MSEFQMIPPQVAIMIRAAEQKIRMILIKLEEELEPERKTIDSIHVDTQDCANMAVGIFVRRRLPPQRKDI